jgi:Flp pilus assembly pilin Flp
MRITAFRRLLADEFGATRAELMARDHVFGALGNRTVEQALEAGVSTREIWRAVCDAFDVPLERR